MPRCWSTRPSNSQPHAPSISTCLILAVRRSRARSQSGAAATGRCSSIGGDHPHPSLPEAPSPASVRQAHRHHLQGMPSHCLEVDRGSRSLTVHLRGGPHAGHQSPPHTPALTPSSAPPRPQKPGLLGRGVQRSGGGGVCGGRLHGSHRQRLPQLTTAATPHLARDRVSWCNVPETAPRTLPQVLAIINRILLLPTRSIILTHHLHPTTRRGPTSPANYLATVFCGRRCWRGGSDSCGDVGVIGCQAVSAPHPTPPHHPTPTSTRFSRDTCTH